MTDRDARRAEREVRRKSQLQSIRELTQQIVDYHGMLVDRGLPPPLVHDLVRDFHRRVIAPEGSEGYWLRYGDYNEYLDAWEKLATGGSAPE